METKRKKRKQSHRRVADGSTERAEPEKIKYTTVPEVKQGTDPHTHQHKHTHPAWFGAKLGS